ncbi:MAG: hypothetical protein R3C56_22025 [Pirellulaceae bacterium]
MNEPLLAIRIAGATTVDGLVVDADHRSHLGRAHSVGIDWPLLLYGGWQILQDA